MIISIWESRLDIYEVNMGNFGGNMWETYTREEWLSSRDVQQESKFPSFKMLEQRISFSYHDKNTETNTN